MRDSKTKPVRCHRLSARPSHGTSRRRLVWLGALVLVAAACAPVATTRVRSSDPQRLPAELAVLPFADESGRSLSAAELRDLQSRLAEKLRAGGHFTQVTTPGTAAAARA